MPTKYTRKVTALPRRQWTQEHLETALGRLNKGEIGVNEAARIYGIPSRTLRRRRRTGIIAELPLGPQSLLGVENEKRLVKHIQKMEKAGFAMDREALRSLAFQFAELLGIQHRFNRETRMAGYDWLSSFLRRNNELSVRQSQGISLVRSEGMNREEANAFFNLLSDVYTEFNFFDHPENIFNMDETGYQLNNEAGPVIATKGAKDVHTIISSERGENVTIITCCSAEGRFLPPVIIFKGVRGKKEFGDGLPAGAKVYMNQKSSFITSELFFRWLKEHFIPRKPPGKTILILDGHTSHRNCFEMLQYAEENDVIIICLPSHTTQALQPLDRSFFKSLKHHLKKEARQWMIHHPGRKIGRLQAGELIGKAWGKAASVEIALSGFRATGIFPLDPAVIPDHFYAISDINAACATTERTVSPEKEIRHRQSPVPGPSGISTNTNNTVEETPSKFLVEISPVPVLPKQQKRRKKQSAEVLTKTMMHNSAMTNKSKHSKRSGEKQAKKQIKYQRNIKYDEISSSSDEEYLAEKARKLKKHKLSILNEGDGKKSLTKCKKPEQSNKHSSQPKEDHCVECLESYNDSKINADWIKCIYCNGWLHEICTPHENTCTTCGTAKQRINKVKINFNDTF